MAIGKAALVETFITKEDAARLVNISIRTVYRYLKMGKIRPITIDKVIGVCKEDVLELKKEKDHPLPYKINKQTIASLMARVSALEASNRIIKRMLNLHLDPLTLSEHEAKTLYEAAGIYLKEGWPPHSEDMWGDLFLRLRQEDLELIERLVDEPIPWLAFYKLCHKMYLEPKREENRDLFAAGRSSLMNLGYLWSIIKGYSPNEHNRLLNTEN